MLILICLVIFTTAAYSENDSITSKNRDAASIIEYIRHAMMFNAQTPQEKVYLHFDNTGYFKGERIWYKAYVVRADNGNATDISKVLYVELVNPSSDVVETQKLPIENGTAKGDIALDSILGTGFYEVRAYTRYMTNWGGNGIFSRVFPVFRAPKTEGDYTQPIIDQISYKKRMPNARVADDSILAEEAKIQELYSEQKGKKPTVRFYPEGGDMVKGLRSRVAFTVTDEFGAAFATSGTLSDEHGNHIATVVTDSLGRGVFEYVPNGQPLHLSVRDHKNKLHSFETQQPKDNGCVLRLDPLRDDNVRMTIYSSDNMRNRLLGYTITHNGSIVECDTFTATPTFQKSFLRHNCPDGVNQLTIFDSKGQIYADRLFFVAPALRSDEDHIQVKATTERLTPCGKVRLSITSVPNSQLSFSAIDQTTMTGGKRGNIYTWMLLSSEVKGYIAHPEYYFEKDDEEHRRAADMLMMTQGWRRYDWKIMEGAETFGRIQPIEDSLYIFGRLTPYRKRNTVDNVGLSVFMYNSAGQSMTGKTVTDKYGNYAFSLPFVNGEWKMQIHTAKNDKRKTYRIGIDRRFSPQARYIIPDETQFIPKVLPNIFNIKATDINATYSDTTWQEVARRERILPTVKVKGKKRYFTNDQDVRWYNEHDGRYYASIYYNIDEELERILDKGEEIPTTFDFLCKKNPLFQNPECKNTPHLCHVSLMDNGITEELFEGYMAYHGKRIAWYINNEYVGLSNRSYTKVKHRTLSFPYYLNDVKSIYIQDYNPEEYKGHTRIYVYTHPVRSSESKKGIRDSYFQGFNAPSTFKTDDYSVLPPMEDFRRTIYWNPDIKTDANGEATVEFYNNSSCTRMYVSAEGMTGDGRFVANP
ncbi:MAG: hypothetical protein NC252_04480 [Roseburia sp.]|nr:hypothetical protein [Roseburia sp.]MCM1420166.1 hypothetical protein [Bacteroides sp.]